MPADPEVGQSYRQEYYKGKAEDAGAVLSLDAQAEVPAGHYSPTLMTQDMNPLEPKVFERSSMPAIVAPVLAVSVSGGTDREELLSYTKGDPRRGPSGSARRFRLAARGSARGADLVDEPQAAALEQERLGRLAPDQRTVEVAMVADLANKRIGLAPHAQRSPPARVAHAVGRQLVDCEDEARRPRRLQLGIHRLPVDEPRPSRSVRAERELVRHRRGLGERTVEWPGSLRRGR